MKNSYPAELLEGPAERQSIRLRSEQAPSAAMVQGHRRCFCGIAFSSYHASGRKRKIPGLWGNSPRKLDDYCAAGRLVTVKTDLVALRMLMRPMTENQQISRAVKRLKLKERADP